MQTGYQLTTRQYERLDIDLPVELVIATIHRDQVSFSSKAESMNDHTVACRTADISPGGFGLIARQFIPGMTQGRICVYSPSAIEADSLHRERLLEAIVSVRRVYMTGDPQAYFIGVNFVSPCQELEAAMKRIVDEFATRTAGGANGHA